MIHVRSEGEAIRQGLNFWPLSDKNSFGLVLRLGRQVLWLRWGKVVRRMYIRSWALPAQDPNFASWR